MNQKQESIMAGIASMLVLFSALVSPMVSIILSVEAMLGFAVYKYFQGNKQPLPLTKLILGLFILLLPLIIGGGWFSYRIWTTNFQDNSELPLVIEKKSLAQELAECLPKSDMASRDKCQQLMATITDYDTCVAAGFPVMESYPQRCQTASGKTFTKEATPPDSAENLSYEGSFACLPHKETNGPVTMECAFGLLTDDGTYYALDLSAVTDEFTQMGGKSRIRVDGAMMPVETLSSDRWSKYNIKGIIRVITVTEL